MNSIDQICCWSGDVFVVAVVDWTVDTDTCQPGSGGNTDTETDCCNFHDLFP